MARLPNFLVIIRSEKLSGKGQGRGAKKRTFRFGKKNVSFPKVETFRFADYTSWKDGKIIFDNTSLKDALRILEKRYNVVFIQKNPARKAAFTGTFTSQRLERILEYFKLSSNIHWKYVDGKDASQKKTHIEIY